MIEERKDFSADLIAARVRTLPSLSPTSLSLWPAVRLSSNWRNLNFTIPHLKAFPISLFAFPDRFHSLTPWSPVIQIAFQFAIESRDEDDGVDGRPK